LAEYLLLELSLILAVASSGIASVEYGSGQARMGLCDAIYDRQYPLLERLACKAMQYVSVRPDLKLAGITYRYGAKSFALNDINIHIPAGSRYGIIGKNGSGKTTLLKIIAGHLRPDSGCLYWGAENISDWLAGKRPTSTVFQDYALFPNMNALENVAFGIRHKRGHAKQEAVAIARDWLARLQLDPQLYRRRPADLSGGEQQRVAIARALAMRPSILLLDEPTAALDTVQREELVSILKNAIQAGSVTSLVIVSHDRDFAFGVCESIAILDEGRLCYEGKLSEVLARPPDAKVALFLGHFNVIRGMVDVDGLFVDAHGEIRLQLDDSQKSATNRRVALVVPHRDVRFESDVERPELTFDTTVSEVVSLGTHFSVRGATRSGTPVWLDITTDPKARIPSTGRCTLAVPQGKAMIVTDNLPDSMTAEV
jgi:ABC-type Fe3+/spermidine/putrescine transport system ATPase subunit